MVSTHSEIVQDKTALFDIFQRVERILQRESIEPGVPRFFEFANLLFLKLLEERQKDPFWASLKAERDKIQHLNSLIIPTLQTRYGAQDVFVKSQMADPVTLKKIVALLDKYHLTSCDTDILGDAYEYFQKHNTPSKQGLGQFFTPRHIAKALAALVNPTGKDTFYDPFCGTGGLLTGAFHIMQKKGATVGFDPTKGKNMFFGKDASICARAAKMNAILHWGDHRGIEQVGNSLSDPVHGKYSIGLTNVPFARDLKNHPYNELYENGLARKKTDVLSVLHLFQSVQKGGRMAVIVPEGFLLGTERAEARRYLTENADLRLVVSLPHGVFMPYTKVKAAIIYLENIRCPTRQDHFWYFDVENDGYTFEKHRKRIEGSNDLDSLQRVNLKETPEEELASLGFAKVPFEKVHQNQEIWIGKHYQESVHPDSPYPMVSLSKLVTFTQTGFSCNASQLTDKGIPFFTLKSIIKETLTSYETKHLSYEIQIPSPSTCLEGDILVALKDKNRESAILGRAVLANQKGAFSSDLAKIQITDPEELCSQYLCYYFQSDAYLKEIKRFAVGSIVKSVTPDNIASIKIPLPPLTIQKQIAAELNHYENLIAEQKEAVNFLQEKRQERLRVL